MSSGPFLLNIKPERKLNSRQQLKAFLTQIANNKIKCKDNFSITPKILKQRIRIFLYLFHETL